MGSVLTLDGLERACVACGADTKRDESRHLAEERAAFDNAHRRHDTSIGIRVR